MASQLILTVLEQASVSPPPATVGDRSLPLTFFDIFWLNFIPVHTVFFYEFRITKTHFIETIIPNLKTSLSTTLKHFFPFAGKLNVFPTTPNRNPEIRYVEGDTISVTFAECNLDFNHLTGNHPRECDQFYHLISPPGQADKVSDYVTIPVFSVQVTLFADHGIAIGMTNHHSLGDAATRFCFLKAWTSIARSGSDESFLAKGSDFPFFDRVINNPKLDEIYLKNTKIETFDKNYQPRSLSGPTDKVRTTVILTRTVINRLKALVSTELPTLEYVSSFTVACAYIWSCFAKLRNDDLELFVFPVDCRARLDPPVPATYFGNCVSSCMMIAKTRDLTGGMEGFVTAAKMIGENLHKMLTDKDGVVKDMFSCIKELYSNGMPTTRIGVTGTPKLKFYEMDFGWGKPKKIETISIDYGGSISMNASRESYEDLEMGVCFSSSEMEDFLRIFHHGLEAYT